MLKNCRRKKYKASDIILSNDFLKPAYVVDAAVPSGILELGGGLATAINAWAVSYMGWVFYASNGTMFWLPGGPWYGYTNYDSDTGAMNIYSYHTELWYYTSAEVFPYYWDYTTELWDLFNGTFE